MVPREYYYASPLRVCVDHAYWCKRLVEGHAWKYMSRGDTRVKVHVPWKHTREGTCLVEVHVCKVSTRVRYAIDEVTRGYTRVEQTTMHSHIKTY